LCVIARREQKDETKSYWIRILSQKNSVSGRLISSNKP
jgi:hypothetical protein